MNRRVTNDAKDGVFMPETYERRVPIIIPVDDARSVSVILASCMSFFRFSGFHLLFIMITPC